MKIQKLLSLTRQAIENYSMLDEGDKVAVGVSGGKDSLTLLFIMHELQKFYPKHFDMMAISCDVGFPDMDFTSVSRWCDALGIRHEIVRTEISKIVFEDNRDERPCSLCAKLRKGAMYKVLGELGFNKIAYAHNKDDFVETALMSLIYEGRFYAFPPKTYLEDADITVIRPMMYVPEKSVAQFANENSLPIIKNTCPVDGATKREYAKKLMEEIANDNRGAKDRIMHAIEHANLADWSLRNEN